MISPLIRFVTKRKWLTLCTVLLAATTIIAACGGGGGGGSTTAGGGVSGTGVSTGAITGFGSVIVNGVEFVSSSAKITVDDTDTDENDLKIGMKVTLRSVNYIASSIEYDPELKGTISNMGASSFEVLRHTVIVNSQTEYSGTTDLNTLNNGDFVEISGFLTSSNEILATLIEKKSHAEEFEIRGTVSNITATTFHINDLIVDYTCCNISLTEGDLVEVEGDNYNDATGTLTAEEVKIENDPEEPGDNSTLQGVITDVSDYPSDFVVSGRTVRVTDRTRFHDGSSSNIKLDVKVKVEGTINSDGILVAKEIEIEDLDIED